MTQAPPDRLDRLESSVERLVNVVTAMDKKLDVHIVKTDERFKAIEQRLGSIDQRMEGFEQGLKSQDNRLTLIAGVVLALFGLLAKMAFFPAGQM